MRPLLTAISARRVTNRTASLPALSSPFDTQPVPVHHAPSQPALSSTTHKTAEAQTHFAVHAHHPRNITTAKPAERCQSPKSSSPLHDARDIFGDAQHVVVIVCTRRASVCCYAGHVNTDVILKECRFVVTKSERDKPQRG